MAKSKTIEKQVNRGELIRDLNKLGIDEKEFVIKRPLKVIPTGFEALDNEILQIGGIPMGFLSQIYGPDQSGKTLFALRICAMAQRLYPQKAIVYIDTEFKFNFDWAAQQGLDTTPPSEGGNFILIQDNIAEEVFTRMIKFANSGWCSLIVLDSLGNSVTERMGVFNPKEQPGKMPGQFAAVVTEKLGLLIKPMVAHEIAVLSVNQVRDKIGVLYGPTIDVPGGRKYKHNLNLNLRTRKVEDIEEGGEVVAVKTAITVERNGWAPLSKTDDQTHPIFFIENGIERSKIAGLYDRAIRLEVIQRAGPWYKLCDGDIIINKWQGKEPLIKELMESEKFQKQLSELNDIRERSLFNKEINRINETSRVSDEESESE